jgi:prepilin-type N-terminal cleavage/methylation domain-containing protein
MKNGDCRDTSESSGFTLVEIIVTIVLIGILGAMSAQFLASALEGSTQPIDRVQAEAGRVSIMEKIISDYVIAVNTSSPPTGALSAVKDAVDNGDYNSGATTVTTAYIDFDSGGQEVAGGSDYLKVSVTTGAAGIVAILSKSRAIASDPMVNF